MKTIWGHVLYGTRTGVPGEHLGVDPNLAFRIRSCAQFFLTICEENEEIFWERSVRIFFSKSQKDYNYKIGLCWKKLFVQYSVEVFRCDVAKGVSLKYIADNCRIIFEAKNKNLELAEIFPLLSPYKDYLSKPRSNADAQFYLGYCYLEGHGVTKNLVEALKYIQLSVDQGDSKAQFYLATMYETGTGVANNPVIAFEFMKLSADQGYARAQFCVSNFYENGYGTEKDLVKAIEYYELSADQGFEDAISNLILVFEAQDNNEKVFKYKKLLADKGNAAAQGSIS